MNTAGLTQFFITFFMFNIEIEYSIMMNIHHNQKLVLLYVFLYQININKMKMMVGQFDSQNY